MCSGDVSWRENSFKGNWLERPFISANFVFASSAPSLSGRALLDGRLATLLELCRWVFDRLAWPYPSLSCFPLRSLSGVAEALFVVGLFLEQAADLVRSLV
jgi:hypothetical protein